MSVFIDRKYLLLISQRLQRFTQKNVDLFNFRCPICGDSETNKNKARGFVYRKYDDYFYNCKNCGAGHNFYNFLSIVDPTLLKEYQLEKFRNKTIGFKQNTYKYEISENVRHEISEIKLPSIESLDDRHFAKAYVIGRKIPKEYHSRLFYANDFKQFIEDLKLDQEFDFKTSDDKRLIIPFYNTKGEMTHFQGRALNSESTLRYITITVDKGYPKIFGLNKLNFNKKIYVFEGPIDSMFIENGIAVADANLTKADQIRGDKVLVFDNQPRNRELVKTIGDSIESGHKICLLPQMQGKDINDLILSGMKSENIKNMIDEHTYQGLKAKIEFNNWRKV